MSKVKVGGNWAYIDRLDGEVLKEGDRVIVTWPDTTVEHVTVQIHSGSKTIYDMGVRFQVPTRKAYITQDLHGMTFELPLRRFDRVKRLVRVGEGARSA